MKLVKRTMLILAVLSAVMPMLPAMGQKVYDKFYDAIHEGDTVAMKEYMGQIRALNEQTAERYVAEYNYYYNKSLSYSGVMTSTELPGKDELVQGEIYRLRDDSTGAPLGYLYYLNVYDYQLVDSALDVISRVSHATPTDWTCGMAKSISSSSYAAGMTFPMKYWPH